ncbi:MAG: adenosylmethionine decarboxylase [Candidatus Kaelpia aquatica]|nr:adenosylmethionine decarboxylase [Candidatus Kaelpia aquatica]
MEKQTIKESGSVYCKEDSMSYAGKHLIIELWGAKNIASEEGTKEVLRKAVKACGATLLEVHAHTFSPYSGISAVAILKESHISVHSWPEFNYAAADIFVCGDVDPHLAVPVLKEGFSAEEVQVTELKRGVFDEKHLGI